MRVVRDFSKTLPIEAFELHFLLSADRYEQYAGMLEKMNYEEDLNLGPFHVTVHNIGNEIDSGFQCNVPELKESNILTRIIDDSDDSYTYGCGNIRFAGKWQDTVREIGEFVFEAYVQNVKNLNSCLTAYERRNNKGVDYRIETLFKIAAFLKKNRVDNPFADSEDSFLKFPADTLKKEAYPMEGGMGIIDVSEPLELIDKSCAHRIGEMRACDEVRILEGLKRKTKRNRNKLKFVGDVLDAIEDNEEVRQVIFRALYGNKRDMQFDECGYPIAGPEEIEEEDFSNLAIGLQRSDNTRLRVRQSVKIEIDGSEYLVALGSKARVFYYALCLICRKKGIPFHRDILLGQRVSQRRDLWRPETLWLRELYRQLFGESAGRLRGEFMTDNVIDSGFRNLLTNMCYGIRDAKSRSNRLIQRELAGQPQPIIDRCKISRGMSSYRGVDWIDVPGQCIRLDRRFDELLDYFPMEFAEYVPGEFRF